MKIWKETEYATNRRSRKKDEKTIPYARVRVLTMKRGSEGKGKIAQ